jgi:hypothetical protein
MLQTSLTQASIAYTWRGLTRINTGPAGCFGSARPAKRASGCGRLKVSEWKNFDQQHIAEHWR